MKTVSFISAVLTLMLLGSLTNITSAATTQEIEPNDTYATAVASDNEPKRTYVEDPNGRYSDMNGTLDGAGNGDIVDTIVLGWQGSSSMYIRVESPNGACKVEILRANGAPLRTFTYDTTTVPRELWTMNSSGQTVYHCQLDLTLFYQENIIVRLSEAYDRMTYKISFIASFITSGSGAKVHTWLGVGRDDATYSSGEPVAVKFSMMIFDGAPVYVCDVYFLVLYEDQVFSLVVDNHGQFGSAYGVVPVATDYRLQGQVNGDLPLLALDQPGLYEFLLFTSENIPLLGRDWRLGAGEIASKTIVMQ